MEENQAREIELKKKLEAIDNRVDVVVDKEYTEYDVKTCLKKIQSAAIKYDKSNPLSMSLNGIETRLCNVELHILAVEAIDTL
jgi:hypothetical protein